MRMVALGTRSFNYHVDIGGVVYVRCMVQAVVDWYGQVRRIPEDWRMSESLLKARRRATGTNGILVRSADKDPGERRVIL